MKGCVAAVALALLLGLAACSRPVPPGTTGVPDPLFEGDPPEDAYVYNGEPGSYGGTLTLATANDMKTFNVILAAESASNDILWGHVFRCLVDYRNGDDPPGYDAGLCTRWESSPDVREWTFFLRRGVRWSDGQPFTADDVLFTYDVIRDPRVASPIRDVFVEGTENNGNAVYPELEKLDDHTVRFKLHKPNGGFLDQVFNLWLIPRHKWEQEWLAGRFNYVMQLGANPEDVVSLGSFRIKEHVAGQRIVLERNPYFWKVDKKGQRMPYLDRVVFVILKDQNTIPLRFEAGELDILTPRVRAEDYSAVKKLEGTEVTVTDTGVSLNTTWLAFNQNTGVNPNTSRPFLEPWKQRLFRSKEFRQAISYGIDRQGLANTVFSGRGAPMYSFVSPGDKDWHSEDVMTYPYAPARAREMLARIGLTDRNGDSFLEDADGHTVEITIITNSENSQRVQTAAFVAQSLREVGIKANSTPLAFSLVSNAIQSSFDFDAVLLGWRAAVPTGPTNYKSILLSSGLQHVCFPKQPSPSTPWEARVDQALHEIEASPDQQERRRLFAEIQRIWSDELPQIDLVAEQEAIAYKNKLGNVHPSPLPPRATWNIEEIYFKR
ncbi:MAG TPA: ABC transporter substrate-binding protein [Blastocatellia bacterium]|nr:ABC transporter substrate-binding protein [Blastocatellia bacterium]